MSIPVVLGVVLSMQTAIQAIAVSGGYNNTVKATSVVIDPTELVGIPSTEVPFMVLGDVRPGVRDFKTTRPNAIADDFIVPVLGRIDAPGTDKARKATAAWGLIADLEVALIVDPQRGGLASYTYVQQPSIYYGLGTQNIVYFELPVRILLRRNYGSP